jgi:hypothetical protein
MRAEIEILFKATKALFGLKDLHIYYRGSGDSALQCVCMLDLFSCSSAWRMDLKLMLS